MARAAEAHQRMFENMTMFSAETREFGGELSAVIAPLGVLNDEVMQAAQGLNLWSGPIAELDEFLSRGPSVKSVGLDKLIDPEVIEKGIDHLEELRKTLDLLAQTGDGMAQRLSAATSIILGAYETMVAGIRKAELKSVFLAIAQAVLSLVNVFRSLGATSQELIDTLDGVESAIDSVRSGSLSAAEAVDRMMNWQGNEEGHQFVLDMIDDFMYLGREADEAVKLVGEFWAAMRAGDQGEMERIGMQLVNVADQARMLREENEKLADTYSTVMSAYERIQDAAESAYQSVYEAAIKAGHTEAEAAEFAAMASEHKAKQQEAIELQKFARLAALEAALTAVRAGNADQAVEIAKQAALDSLAAWAAALEAMAELDSAIQSVIDATVGNIEDISFEFEALGTGASGAAGGVSEVADAAKEAEDALKELVGAVDGLGIAFDHLNREIAADVLGQKLAKYEDQFQTLVNAGQDVDRALAGMSDDSIRSIGELALEAHNLGMELTYVQHTALQMYAALRSDEIAERLQEIREARETRLDLDSIDARLRALRHQQSVYEEQHEERVRQINAERDARLSAIDRETEALKAQRFDTEDVWEAARSFGFTSRDQLGPNFLQEQGAAKIKEVSDEIRKLQLTGLSDEALAGNEVVQSRMARLVSDIEEYGLKGLPEHLAGLAKILGYENVEIGTGLSTLNDTIWNLEQERTRVEQNAVEAIERENRRREEAERSFTEQIESLEMERRAIEDARLERERERLLIEEERLMAERELLRQVTSMLRSRPKPPKPTPQPASKPKLHPSAVKPAPKPKKKPKPAPAPTTTTPAPAPAPTPAPAPAPVPVPRPPTPEPGPHPGGTGPPVGEGDAYQRGSGGIRDFGAGTRAVLHNREAVVTESSWLEAIERAGRGSGMRHQQRAVEQFFKATMASVEMERQAIEDAQRVRAIEKRHYQDDFASGRSAVIRRRQERQGPTTEDFRAALEDVNVVVNGDVNVDGTTFGTFVLKKGARTAHLRGLR